jgi:hypothetical protein
VVVAVFGADPRRLAMQAVKFGGSGTTAREEAGSGEVKFLRPTEMFSQCVTISFVTGTLPTRATVLLEPDVDPPHADSVSPT